MKTEILSCLADLEAKEKTFEKFTNVNNPILDVEVDDLISSLNDLEASQLKVVQVFAKLTADINPGFYEETCDPKYILSHNTFRFAKKHIENFLKENN